MAIHHEGEESADEKQIPSSIVNDRIFEKLKIKEDQLHSESNTKNFYLRITKKRKHVSRSDSLDESKENHSGPTLDDTNAYGDNSRITKAEESDEEFITEELFQKALQATLKQGNCYFYLYHNFWN